MIVYHLQLYSFEIQNFVKNMVDFVDSKSRNLHIKWRLARKPPNQGFRAFRFRRHLDYRAKLHYPSIRKSHDGRPTKLALQDCYDEFDPKRCQSHRAEKVYNATSCMTCTTYNGPKVVSMMGKSH